MDDHVFIQTRKSFFQIVAWLIIVSRLASSEEIHGARGSFAYPLQYFNVALGRFGLRGSPNIILCIMEGMQFASSYPLLC
ncbi:hypothetical protein GQ44DRAFT_705964, partial [Phaeosphaeriaceae sp. PMI808]